jgi:hypothetical protein
LENAFAALRAGKNSYARQLFGAYLSLHPQDADALVGAGFAALRDDDPVAAIPFFRKTLSVSPGYDDAFYGLALALERTDDKGGAVAAIAEAYRISPGRDDIDQVYRRLTPVIMPQLPPASKPANFQLKFKAEGAGGYQVLEKGLWKPFFWKGINLGAALPGRYPSEFPDKAVYASWLKDMGDVGFNLIRIYTIHPPTFYEALLEYNLSHAKPIYLVHGVWAELPPEDNFLDADWYGDWKAEMRNVIDLVHGRANIVPRPGHASGVYRADLSPWLAGIILGREWEPGNVENFNNRFQSKVADFSGRFVSCRKGSPMELFLAQAMEYFLAYETDTYNAQCPIAFTNWPTTDPLFHLSESTKKEESALRKKMGLPFEEGQTILEYDNDSMSLDMEKYDAGPEDRAGLFASYHAYPYYPDFINLDKEYAAGRDSQGPNNYVAYLQSLVKYHRKHPVVISEFGVPSSRLVAHWQVQGMSHGGLDETAQGKIDVRLLGDIHDSGCSGAVLFAWIDEWFKKNWLVIEFEEPLDRKPKWYNYQDAEENYGLIGYRPGDEGPTIAIDGDPSDWATVPVYLSNKDYALKVIADEGWVHLGIFGTAPKQPAPGGFFIGIDTHGLQKGDHKLPFGIAGKSLAGLEFAVLFQGDKAAVFADKPYDLFTHRYMKPYQSVDNSDGIFVMQKTESNRMRIGRDGTVFPAHQQEIGWLKKGSQDRNSPAFDSMAEWTSGPGFIEARIPWGLLNVTDPSSRAIVSTPEGLAKGPEGVPVTDGFRFVFAAYAGDAFSSKALQNTILPPPEKGVVPQPPLFTWKTWEEPSWHSFKKQAYYIYKKGLADIAEK